MLLLSSNILAVWRLFTIVEVRDFRFFNTTSVKIDTRKGIITKVLRASEIFYDALLLSYDNEVRHMYLICAVEVNCMKYKPISIWDIVDVWNDRKEILDNELTESIKKNGLEHVISVIERPNDRKYTLRSGRRRLASLIELVTNHNCPHLSTVMCEIHPYSDEKELIYDRLRDDRYTKRRTGFERGRLVREAKSLGASDEEIAAVVTTNTNRTPQANYHV